MRSVRINFNKTGVLKYISHLDMIRCITRAVRRSKLPIWYTEGFNPHPYLNFGLPVSLGIESYNDVLDVKLPEDYPLAQVAESLNAVLPANIVVTKVYEPVNKTQEIAFAEYNIILDENYPLEEAEAVLREGKLTYEKLGKKNGKKVLKTVNLSENIKSYSFTAFDGRIILNAVLAAGNTVNINPFSLIECINAKLSVDFDAINIERKRLFLADMKEFV